MRLAQQLPAPFPFWQRPWRAGAPPSPSSEQMGGGHGEQEGCGVPMGSTASAAGHGKQARRRRRNGRTPPVPKRGSAPRRPTDGSTEPLPPHSQVANGGAREAGAGGLGHGRVDGRRGKLDGRSRGDGQRCGVDLMGKPDQGSDWMEDFLEP
ncbi:unnamed protein product, partial [Urochloa humidicola]